MKINATEAESGFEFAGWKNSAGEVVSTDNPASLTAFAKNDTYTASYEETVKYSEGLEFKSNGDGTCYVSGIGTCTDTDIVIPPVSPDGDSVTSIDNWAFYYCTSLTSVTIPDSVTSIGYEAFSGCSSLANVYYTGSEEEWKAISIGSSNTYLTNAAIHYNYVPEE